MGNPRRTHVVGHTSGPLATVDDGWSEPERENGSRGRNRPGRRTFPAAGKDEEVGSDDPETCKQINAAAAAAGGGRVGR